MGQTRLGQSTHQRMQDLDLETDLVVDPWRLFYWDAPTGEFKSWGYRQTRLGKPIAPTGKHGGWIWQRDKLSKAPVPTGNHKNQNGCETGRQGQSISQVTLEPYLRVG